MTTVTLRRSPRIAAKLAAKALENTKSKPSYAMVVMYHVPPCNSQTTSASSSVEIKKDNTSLAIAEIKTMLEVAEKNRSEELSKRILHIANMFEFMLSNALDTVYKRHPKFRNVVKEKLIEFDLELQQKTLPYWISIKYNNSAKNLKAHIASIEQAGCIW